MLKLDIKYLNCNVNFKKCSMYVCIYVCMYICMYVCIYVCMYVYIYVFCIYLNEQLTNKRIINFNDSIIISDTMNVHIEWF